MLDVNNIFDNHAAARMLDFFGARTPWQRSLWSPGTVLSLQEVLEASRAVHEGILSEPSLRNLVEYTISLVGSDPGVGPPARKQALIRALKTALRVDGAEYTQVLLHLQDIERDYMQNWALALRANTGLRPERSARYIASFLLDAGFSAPYLHRWMTYRVQHETATRTLADFLEDAALLVAAAQKNYRVLVAFEAAAEGRSGPPANWVEASAVTEWLQNNHHSVTGIRQNGGMWFEIEAPDPWSAVGKVVEIVDRLTSRVILGTNGRLVPFPSAWVEGQTKRFRFGVLPRRVQVHALHREDKLYTLTQSGIVDAALELLAPLESGSPGPAVTGAWAAIEALLSGPGDQDVLAADRLASLVACSFVRAELTALSYVLQQSDPTLAPDLAACTTNRDRAAVTAKRLTDEPATRFGDPSDHAAIVRMQRMLASPLAHLRDIEGHVGASFRRLYRQRNLIIHGGKTDAVGLNATLRTVAPLVGAGIDRIAHGWFVDSIRPTELAARARIGIDLVESRGAKPLIDLLQ